MQNVERFYRHIDGAVQAANAHDGRLATKKLKHAKDVISNVQDPETRGLLRTVCVLTRSVCKRMGALQG